MPDLPMPDLILGGIPLLLIVPLVIEALKRYAGLTTEHAPLVNGVLCVGAYVVATLAKQNPTFEMYAVAVVQGLIVFLGGAGFYHMAIKPRVSDE
jgi:hypothetical protein